MRDGVLTQTTVSEGQRARAASSVVYWPACRAAGAPTFDAGAELEFDDCHQGKREPDWGAGRAPGRKPAPERTRPRTRRPSLDLCGTAPETAATSGRRSYQPLLHLSTGSRMPSSRFDRSRARSRNLAPPAATRERESQTEGQARRWLSMRMVQWANLGACGTAPETGASSERRSFQRSVPASIRLRTSS